VTALDPVIEMAAVSKDYHGLRPLRIERFTLAEGERTAIVGLDQPMAETFVNLVIGAALPDRGEISIFGRPTASIDESNEWLALVDRCGMVSERAVLLESLSVLQNLAIPFTLDIEPPTEEVQQQVGSLAREVGLDGTDLSRPVAAVDATDRLLIRLGRALALDPELLLLEHATAQVTGAAVEQIGARIAQIARRRGCAVLAVTADRQFAGAVAARVLTHEPATGRLAEPRWRDRLFGR
jgi:ABC-type transporter Mla maintaining outer membrane lipid asymmetry ATPase subunit MlaF